MLQLTQQATHNDTVRKEVDNLEHRSDSLSLAPHSKTAAGVESASAKVRIRDRPKLILLMLTERVCVCVCLLFINADKLNC